VPTEFSGKTTKGVDDYFSAGGTLDTLVAVATLTAPDTEIADDTFSDSRLAETLGDEVLTDHFVWCKPLGWLGWTGQQWAAVTEETVGEAVRQHVLQSFVQATEGGNTAAARGWFTMLTASRQGAVLKLARGIVERFADEFDRDPDLLNTPGGVVHLPTGEVQPHDPELLITKIARGSYRPGFTHRDWELALTALPEDTRGWFQVRAGQAITGHPTSDGLIPVCQGNGENGKSALLTDGLMPAFGDYASPASPKLIAAKNEHSTERADLHGQRLIIAEELTEERALNITAIKQISDVGMIKARYVHKDNMTFHASHSLFVTTNYVPTVNETDHGTWRRLALVEFPFTYRKRGEALGGAGDRHGDPRLKARLRSGTTGQHDAIVTWAVEGARTWYAFGFPALPPAVEESTRAWRKQSDRILCFWEECLAADRSHCIITTEMHAVFNAWMKANGHHEWSKELFHSRFKSHAETGRYRLEERRPRHLDVNVSRPPGAMDQPSERPHIYVGVRFRTLGERTECIEEQSSWSKRSDTSRSVLNTQDPRRSAGESDHSDHACCEGGSLKPTCKLCPHLPNHWRQVVSAELLPVIPATGDDEA
jgi:P4 family phage/plasmid primase-like protien